MSALIRALLIVAAAHVTSCSWDIDPALVPSRFCEASDQTAASRGLQPGDVFRSNDGCAPSERKVCGKFVDGTFREEACPPD